jgi:Predicted transcriptional regulator
MKIASRFTIAVHTLLFIQTFHEEYRITSEFIASSVNVNPVVIRRILGQLKDAGMVTISRGTGGTSLAKEPKSITLFDIYNAVDSVDDTIFGFHESPNPKCPVGGNIHAILDSPLENAQSALELSLKRVKLQDLIANLESKLKS